MSGIVKFNDYVFSHYLKTLRERYEQNEDRYVRVVNGPIKIGKDTIGKTGDIIKVLPGSNASKGYNIRANNGFGQPTVFIKNNLVDIELDTVLCNICKDRNVLRLSLDGKAIRCINCKEIKKVIGFYV